jgi:selenocysteine lyase/cysteine desulfurase
VNPLTIEDWKDIYQIREWLAKTVGASTDEVIVLLKQAQARIQLVLSGLEEQG